MESIIGAPIFYVNRHTDVYIGENINMSIGQRIKERRKAIGLTQSQLAAKVGMKQSSISELENGDSSSTTNVAKIAQALKVNALWLETGAGDGMRQDHANPAGLDIDKMMRKLAALIDLDLISQQDAALLKHYWLASEDGRDKIQTFAELAEREQLLVVHHQAQ
jgi:transcriptional regulator with XRE-family HTH domain